MDKKAAIVLVCVMLSIVAWGVVFEAGSTSIIINGQEITGPFKGAIGAAGLIISVFALFCAAILLLFVFTGIGIFLMGGMLLIGLMLAGLAFPLLLILLLPLFIVWLFIALTRKAENKG